jgi:hypothetical protein
MGKTQPLIRMPNTVAPSAPLYVSSMPERDAEEANANRILAPFWWALLIVSAVILIIQIWTYLS